MLFRRQSRERPDLPVSHRRFTFLLSFFLHSNRPSMNGKVRNEFCRPKRTGIPKPTRYQTTSSEEERVPKMQPHIYMEQSCQEIAHASGTYETVPIEDEYTLYNFNTQDTSHTPQYTPTHTHSHPYAHTYAQQAPGGYNSELTTRVAAVEAQLRNLDEKVDKMIALMTRLAATRGVPENTTVQKPQELPLQTVDEIEHFNFVAEEKYDATVKYLHCVGGFSLKEATRLCFKEVFEDGVLQHYSWLGREEGNLPLRSTRITKAIHDALRMTAQYPKPSKRDSAVAMMAALRTTKERLRTQNRRSRCICASSSNVDNYWTDDQHE